MKTSARSHQKSSLQLRLGAWDDVASQAVSRADRRSRNWLLYSAAVGSALAMATDAGAQIMNLSGPPMTLTAGSGGINAAPFGVGPAMFDLFGAQFPSYGAGVVGLGAAGKAGILLNSSGMVRQLASGAKISSGAGHFFGGNQDVKFAGFSGSKYGTFLAGVPGFAGFEFNTGGRGTSNSVAQPEIHYGWLKLEYLGSPFPTTICVPSCSSSTQSLAATAVIFGAYNTVAGQAITAGQASTPPGATPEPSSDALALLAMGAAGVLAWRRTRAALKTV